MDENQFPKLDKTAFFIFSSFEEAEKADEEYWLSKTPKEHLQYMELLQKFNLWIYGGKTNKESQFD